MSDIVGYDVVFRSREDFKADAERRKWLESQEGQETLERARIWQERLHLAAMIRSAEYSDGQAILERLIRGEAADFSSVDTLLTAEQAVRNWIQSEKQAN